MENRSVQPFDNQWTMLYSFGRENDTAFCQDMGLVSKPELDFTAQVRGVIRI
jgi:hypothetical protein